MSYSTHSLKMKVLFKSRSALKRIPVEKPPTSIRLSRLMALAIRFEDLIKSGEVENYSELAARYGVERGRISQIMHLRLLAPDIQEKLLSLDESEENLYLKHMLPICRIAYWEAQRTTLDSE